MSLGLKRLGCLVPLCLFLPRFLLISSHWHCKLLYKILFQIPTGSGLVILCRVPGFLSLPPFFSSFSHFLSQISLWAQSWHWELHVKDAGDATGGRDILCKWGMPSSLHQNSREEKQTFFIHGEMGDQELLWEMLCPLGENSQEDLGSSLQGFLIFLAEHQNHRGVEEYIVLNDDEFIEE